MSTLLKRQNIATKELYPGDLSIVREGSGALGLKPTNNRFYRTGNEAGPDVVWPPDGVWTSVKVSVIITNEAHTI